MTQSAAPRRFDERWRLSRAGIVNVWHYLDNEFDLSGGRMILRGTNGSGKSRALEMLLPFLLDADRRKMDATGAARVNLDELMRTGAREQANRTGYLWLELARPGEYLTVGALVRHSQSASTTKVWYFTTPLRVGDELALLSDTREPLAREMLTELIGAERITDTPAAHRDRVRIEVFGLDGDTGRDRYDGLLQLLHTLRAPDVGNRIDEGRLPQILVDSLPPLHEHALARAGEQLDGLTETRAAQGRLEHSAEQVASFLSVYQRYAAATLRATADDTLAAADSVTAAERAAAQRAREVASLESEHGRLQSREQELTEGLTELDHALRAIESRDIFKTADDLVQRDRAVEALAGSADQALAGAERERAHHAQAVDDAEQAVREVRRAVADTATALAAAREAVQDAGLPVGRLPVEVRALDRPSAGGSAVLRISRDGEPRAITRPAASLVDVVPPDFDDARQAAESARSGAADRQSLAARRLDEARRLAMQEDAVARLAAEADRLAATAESDAQAADNRAAERDAAAVELAHAWRTWTADPATSDLLGDPDWAGHPLIGALLLDAEALAGRREDPLAELDDAAEAAARPARAALQTARAGLHAAERADREREGALRTERADLAAARDPNPPDPPWLISDRPGEPLWRCIDFADHVPDAERAGLEGALLAAGLLGAVLTADGSVRAADGELLIIPGAARPARPSSAVLRPDPAAALPAATIAAVLDSIGVDDRDAATAVSTDGSWRNGPLHGRHVVDRARHIGAAARAAHRKERIAAIDDELSVLAEAAEQRRQRHLELAETDIRLDALLRAAPRTSALYAARRLAADALARAERVAADAVREAARAREVRASHAAEVDAHRGVCVHHELPAEAEALQLAVDAARRAGERSAQLTREFSRLAESVQRHDVRVARVEAAAGVRDGAEREADDRWSEWHAAASELAAQHQALDLSIEQAREELERTKDALRETGDEHRTATKAVAELGPRLGSARTASENAAAHVLEQLEQMVAAAQRFTRRMALPGLAVAATAERLAGIVHPDQVDEVRAGAGARAGRGRRAASAGLGHEACSRPSATSTARCPASSTPGTRRTTTCNWSRSPAWVTSAPSPARLGCSPLGCEQGRAALSEREREVFTRFVLGGVAEELRHRVNQAGQLIAAMNASLQRHPDKQRHRRAAGLGAARGARRAGPGARARRDVRRRPVRGAERRADRAATAARRELHYTADPSSGYAAHLAAALDYRKWHEVTVTILGPEAGQQRRLSRRAKLSQGETRFVSYVTLFAAADGYLTSLGDDGRALRLILFDDAFAKVDEGTVAELMGLLVDTRPRLRDDRSRVVGLLPAGAASGRVRGAAQRRQLGGHHPRALGRARPGTCAAPREPCLPPSCCRLPVGGVAAPRCGRRCGSGSNAPGMPIRGAVTVELDDDGADRLGGLLGRAVRAGADPRAAGRPRRRAARRAPAGRGLVAVVAELTGGPLRDRPAERAESRAGRARIWARPGRTAGRGPARRDRLGSAVDRLAAPRRGPHPAAGIRRGTSQALAIADGS